jgi:hypothetical protein
MTTTASTTQVGLPDLIYSSAIDLPPTRSQCLTTPWGRPGALSDVDNGLSMGGTIQRKGRTYHDLLWPAFMRRCCVQIKIPATSCAKTLNPGFHLSFSRNNKSR